jgi:hypothetical protein
MSGRYRSPLVYERVSANLWRLTEPLGYSSDVYPPGFTVPMHFETDFASHPRWKPLNWTSRRLLGTLVGTRWSVIHDYAYRVLVAKGLMLRGRADALLDEAMRADD